MRLSLYNLSWTRVCLTPLQQHSPPVLGVVQVTPARGRSASTHIKQLLGAVDGPAFEFAVSALAIGYRKHSEAQFKPPHTHRPQDTELKSLIGLLPLTK